MEDVTPDLGRKERHWRQRDQYKQRHRNKKKKKISRGFCRNTEYGCHILALAFLRNGRR